MTQIACKDTHKRRDYKIKLHLFTFIQLINRTILRKLSSIETGKGLTSRPALHILSKIQIGMT